MGLLRNKEVSPKLNKADSKKHPQNPIDKTKKKKLVIKRKYMKHFLMKYLIGLGLLISFVFMTSPPSPI